MFTEGHSADKRQLFPGPHWLTLTIKEREAHCLPVAVQLSATHVDKRCVKVTTTPSNSHYTPAHELLPAQKILGPEIHQVAGHRSGRTLRQPRTHPTWTQTHTETKNEKKLPIAALQNWDSSVDNPETEASRTRACTDALQQFIPKLTLKCALKWWGPQKCPKSWAHDLTYR